MTPEEIRALPGRFQDMQPPLPSLARYDGADTAKTAAMKLTLLVEIAAQLAEINVTLTRAVEIMGRPNNLLKGRWR